MSNDRYSSYNANKDVNPCSRLSTTRGSSLIILTEIHSSSGHMCRHSAALSTATERHPGLPTLCWQPVTNWNVCYFIMGPYSRPGHTKFLYLDRKNSKFQDIFQDIRVTKTRFFVISGHITSEHLELRLKLLYGDMK